MGNTLVGWIEDKLQETGWSQRELARRANVSHSMVSKVVSGEKTPGIDFCTAIARTFGERPEKVLRLAGLLPPSGGKLNDLSEDEGQLIEMYRQFRASDRPRVLRVVKGMLLTADEAV